MKSKSLLYILISSFSLSSFLFLNACSTNKDNDHSIRLDDPETVFPVLDVGALGQLTTSGDVRRLAAPISGMGGTPRVLKLLVDEGDKVKVGQNLAIFDSRPRLKADLEVITTRIKALEIQIERQQKEIARYTIPTKQGASTLAFFEEKKDELISLEGDYLILMSQKNSILTDLQDSQLRSPIDGVILRVLAREGERPGIDGVLEVGFNDVMEALVEVYESDIGRVSNSQSVQLVSENGGFSGILKGKVVRISPQVRQRRVLSTDPTGDADARVVPVRVKLDPSSSRRVTHLTGMKVIARFLSDDS